ncbi:MAG: hypothetical protein KJ804_13605 [Proteobacteria bacterium]|nr:hypothetical protein [Pseudomonadota bacterium]MBU1059344.1 hypothetical protein [Pseudomonadota bacterium]
MNYEAKLSDIIASLPEIQGGFLFAPERGVYGNQATGITNVDDLLQVALKFSKIFSQFSVHFHDTGNFRVTFKDLVLFATVLEQGQWLFLFYRPSLSPSMVNMTVQLALNIQSDDEEEKDILEITPPLAEPTPTSITPENKARNTGIAPESKLNGPLNTLKNELSKYIGPVAELIFEDFREEWETKFSPTPENLPELIRVLAEEIDNANDRKTFKKAMETFSGKE